MRCLEPRTIRVEGMIMHFHCGSCEFCLANKRNEWYVRLLQEEKESTSSYFVTLTYDDNNIPYGDGCYTLSKSDVKAFLKKLRRIYAPSTKVNHGRALQFARRSKIKRYVPKTKIRYYLAGEYGEKTGRPHYHAIIFNGRPDDIIRAWTHYDRTSNKHIEIGFVDIKPVNTARLKYVTKYIINKNDDSGERREKPFQLASKGNANTETRGIGYGYIKKAIKYHRAAMDSTITLPDGVKIAMPKYFKKFIFTQDERKAIYDKFLLKEYEKYKKDLEEKGIDRIRYLETMRTITRINRIKNSNKSSELK